MARLSKRKQQSRRAATGQPSLATIAQIAAAQELPAPSLDETTRSESEEEESTEENLKYHDHVHWEDVGTDGEMPPYL